jgi:hypothetical protein
MRDQVNVTNGMIDRFYLNGTVARFNASGAFQLWLVAPVNNTLATFPTGLNITVGQDGSKTVVSGLITTFYSPPLNMNSSQIENATGILYQQKDSILNQTRTYYRNGSASVVFWSNNSLAWIVAPTAIFVPYQVSVNPVDGSTTTRWADGRTSVVFKEPSPDTPDFERYTAMSRNETFPNGTNVQTFFNGTVAEWRNGSFFGYRVPPKFLIVKIDYSFNPDGSQQINYSNGSSVWLAPPPPKNESAEQFASRVIRIDAFNLTKIVAYANGTVANFTNGTLAGYIVAPPKGFLVYRTVVSLPDGGIRETFSNGTIRTTYGPVPPGLDDLAKARLVVFEDLDNNT